MLAATQAMQTVAARIRQDGTPTAILSELPRFNDFLNFIGLPEVRALENRFAVSVHASGENSHQ
jgi:2-methylisocitrate lyase-like PEP mutase family enzyme